MDLHTLNKFLTIKDKHILLYEHNAFTSHLMLDSDACNNLIVVRYDVSQCFNIFYRDNSSHPLRHIPCKLDLMIIHMLIELMLTRHNDGRFSNL